MAVKLKKGVQVGGVRPEMVVALVVANGVFARFNVDAVVTSCSEGTHSINSRHYMGCGLDFRTHTVSPGQHVDLRDALIDALGTDFNVILEGSHIHIGFRPGKLK